MLNHRALTHAALSLVLLVAGLQVPAVYSQDALDPALYDAIEYRLIGPYRGGRSATVTGIPGDRDTYYFGATGGGVWKSSDGGGKWANISDGFFGGSVGAVAVSESSGTVRAFKRGQIVLRRDPHRRRTR